MKKFLALGALALLLATPAHADWHGRGGGGNWHGNGGWHGGGGGWVGPGVVLGLGGAAILGGLYAAPPVYYAPPPVYYAPPPQAYYPTCPPVPQGYYCASNGGVYPIPYR